MTWVNLRGNDYRLKLADGIVNVAAATTRRESALPDFESRFTHRVHRLMRGEHHPESYQRRYSSPRVGVWLIGAPGWSDNASEAWPRSLSPPADLVGLDYRLVIVRYQDSTTGRTSLDLPVAFRAAGVDRFARRKPTSAAEFESGARQLLAELDHAYCDHMHPDPLAPLREYGVPAVFYGSISNRDRPVLLRTQQ